MKVIFLDIDGVLNSQRTYLAYGGYPFPEEDKGPHSKGNMDWIAVAMVKRLARKYKAEIVLHSSWRTSVTALEMGRILDLEIKEITNPNVEKSRSIKEYLILHPEIDKYVILDDDPMYDENDCQVFVNGARGLSAGNYDRASMILENE